MCDASADTLDRLFTAVDRVAAEPTESVATSALGDELIALRRVIDRLEAQFVRRLERFDRGHGALADGALSTVSWLRSACRMTAAAAVDRVRLGRALVDLPLVERSFAGGHAPLANVSLLGRLAEEVGAPRLHDSGMEEPLMNAAETVPVSHMGFVTSAARHRLDPDGVLDADNLAHERRWFACDQTYGGVFILRGELDAEGGALVKTALDALSAPASTDDARRASQRRADAIVELASRRLHAGDLPEVHGQRPHLTLTVSAASLALAAAESGAPAPDSGTSDIPTLSGVGSISTETARRLACDAVVRVARLGAGGRALSVGRATRTVPAPIRAALTWRDRGCRYPGCDRPPSWTDAHHILHWADGGETSVDNLVSVCRRHHRMVHERGQRLRLEVNGAVTVEPDPSWAARHPRSRARSPTSAA